MTLWFLARAAGWASLLAATLSVALGALSTSAPARHDRDRDARVVRQRVHRSAGVLTLGMLGLHAVLLVLDTHVALTVPGLLVPFTAGYRGFALGLGTLAAYGFVVVALTGALRGRAAASPRAARAWRAVHLGALGGWGLAMAHGVLAGTDTGTWWSWGLYAGCALAVLAAVGARTEQALAQHRSPLPAARRRLVPGGTR